MDISNLITHIEALIFASEKPLTALDIVELINNAFGFMDDKVTLDQVETAIEGTREKYAAEFYPFELRQSGGGWQFLTKRAYHKTIAQLNGDKFLKRLSTAALETLAIIAYKAPITKSEIESIRGVNSDYSIQKLLEKELILITGRNENLPGKPLVYNTTRNFMDYFGLNSQDELPKINEVLADQIVEPTLVNADHFEVEEGDMLSVTPEGELVLEADIQEMPPAADGETTDAGPEAAANDAMTDTTEDAEGSSDETEASPDTSEDSEENAPSPDTPEKGDTP
jgi:segregation and condensation protein B